MQESSLPFTPFSDGQNLRSQIDARSLTNGETPASKARILGASSAIFSRVDFSRSMYTLRTKTVVSHQQASRTSLYLQNALRKSMLLLAHVLGVEQVALEQSGQTLLAKVGLGAAHCSVAILMPHQSLMAGQPDATCSNPTALPARFQQHNVFPKMTRDKDLTTNLRGCRFF